MMRLTHDEPWTAYLALWAQCADENPRLIDTLVGMTAGLVLADRFAISPISQARPLAVIPGDRGHARRLQQAKRRE
jgi:hypothetical protein